MLLLTVGLGDIACTVGYANVLTSECHTVQSVQVLYISSTAFCTPLQQGDKPFVSLLCLFMAALTGQSIFVCSFSEQSIAEVHLLSSTNLLNNVDGNLLNSESGNADLWQDRKGQSITRITMNPPLDPCDHVQ